MNTNDLNKLLDQREDELAALRAENARLRGALEKVMPMVNAYYRTYPDDGVQQDFLMREVIEPARAALEAK